MTCPLCDGPTRSLGTFACLERLELGLRFCQECGSMFRDPMPTEQQLAEYYGGLGCNVTGAIVRRRMRKCRFQAQALVGWLEGSGLRRDVRILDLGAGYGGLVRALRDRGLDAEGLEPREEAVACADRIFGVRLHRGGLFEAHVRAESEPGLLVLSHVLEHLPDPERVLRYLKEHFEGAVLWIEVPDGGWAARERDGHVAWRFWLPQHVWSFTEAGLRTLMARCGLRVLRAERIVTYPLIARMRNADLEHHLAGRALREALRSRRRLPRAAVRYAWHTARYALLRVCHAAFCSRRRRRIPDSQFNIRLLAKM